ncbi:MAG: dTDP-4-dehydrorhamnose 3,5-epimerase [Patescibacteria group bacterium]|nr:dTDP-4-dehydrorhamnose 3,5-epimerase [Patescibacteria group bacterium]MDD5715121.1 dTDP-4-dehydrorhamnose 3,5-epimerase [Patescibacteria group bacterium]
MPEFIRTNFPDAWLIKPDVHRDERGFFLETYSSEWLTKEGITAHFIQDNHSMSKAAGVLRGLHFQLPPHAQAKLVRVVRGSVYDVIVDLRRPLKTYGTWQGFELTASNFLMLYIPRGFAHGFCTLEPDTEFMYKVDNLYAPNSDSGIRWNDPTLNIPWPVTKPSVSAKDSSLGFFQNFTSPFTNQ